MGVGTEAQNYVWEGEIPLQIRLHESEITTHSPPPPALVHFRGYPGDVLSPCDGEDSVKWSFINSLKEAAYIINGNCKNVMNMSQSDQLELWRSLVNGKMEGYLRISSKLKLGTVGEKGTATVTSCSTQPRQTISEIDTSGPSRTGRIPVRLYVRNVGEDVDDFEEAISIDSWDTISYVNRPVEIHGEDSKIFTLRDALKILLPEFFEAEPSIDELSTMENEESRTTKYFARTGLRKCKQLKLQRGKRNTG